MYVTGSMRNDTPHLVSKFQISIFSHVDSLSPSVKEEHNKFKEYIVIQESKRACKVFDRF